MKNYFLLVCSLFFASVFISDQAEAHHSAVGYDIESRISITGQLSKVRFRNPHGTLEIDVTEKDGKPIDGKAQEWEVETAAANLLQRRGWDFKEVKRGMTVTLIGHPSKDGSPLMYLREIHLPDGTVMGDPKGLDKALD